jgi:hypothetical protein
LIQPDIFSNESQIYRLRVEPTIGTKINGVVSLGLSDFLVLKDEGVILNRLDFISDNLPSFTSSVLSHVIGCQTFNGWTKGDDQWVYFAGLQDIYRYRQYKIEPLIEREDGNDWLNTYRNVLTTAQKSALTLWYLPQGIVYFDFGIGNQYALYPEYGWTEVAFNQGDAYFKWITTLNDGTVIGLCFDHTNAQIGFMQFQNPTTGAVVFTDNGTKIVPYIDTGDLYFDEKDFVCDKVVVNRIVEDSQGTLETKIYTENQLIRPFVPFGNDWGYLKTSPRLQFCLMVGDRTVGYFWKFLYNTNATPETLKNGTQYQIDSIEFYGSVRTRSKRASDINPLPDQFILDKDQLDTRNMG